jgi:hypothetical protein
MEKLNTLNYLSRPRRLMAVLFLLAAWALSTSFTPAPVVAWLNGQEHDFGAIPAGRPVHYVFRFKNTSDAPILLQTARTTCGCTAARWTEEPVAPGAEGKLTIEYDAYQTGSFNKKVRVFFDKQRKPEILRVMGDVE